MDYTADPANGFQVYKPEIKLIKKNFVIFVTMFQILFYFLMDTMNPEEDKKIYVKRKLANLLLAKIASPGRWQL